MVKVLDQIETDETNTSLTISHSEKLLSQTEYDQLVTCKASEQMFILLNLLGMQDEVEYAMASLELEFTPEAAALNASIQDRIALMTKDELAAFTEMINQFFALTTDGEADAAKRELIFEINYTTEESTVIEYFCFSQNEEAVWTLSRLGTPAEIAE